MQIKSWQIALIGIIISVFFIDGSYLYLFRYPNLYVNSFISLWLIVVFVPVLLYIDTIKNPSNIISLFSGVSKFGAIVSLISGSIMLTSGNYFWFGENAKYFSSKEFEITGVFFIIAGIHYFWKKV